MLSTTGNALQPTAMGDRTVSPARAANPWVSDHVLLNLSLWWVQNTREADAADLPAEGEVGIVFRSLQRELQ